MPHRNPPHDAPSAADPQADRTIILSQLTLGALLVILGGLGALIFGVAFSDEEEISWRSVPRSSEQAQR